MKIGEEIKKLRNMKGLTLLEVGEASDVSQSYLSQIETGNRNASPEFLSKVAVALGVSKLHLYRTAGLLDDTDILELVDENKRLREELAERPEVLSDEEERRLDDSIRRLEDRCRVQHQARR